MNKVTNIGDILVNEFIKPNNLTIRQVALRAHVPATRMYDLVHNERRISADTSIRLGKVFGVPARYFLDLQSDVDLADNERKHAHDYDQIQQVNYSDVGK